MRALADIIMAERRVVAKRKASIRRLKQRIASRSYGWETGGYRRGIVHDIFAAIDAWAAKERTK